jgi:hypothetical protein
LGSWNPILKVSYNYLSSYLSLQIRKTPSAIPSLSTGNTLDPFHEDD